MGWGGPWLASPSLKTRALIPQHMQSLSGIFHIVDLSSSVEILRSGTSCCKIFMKSSLALKRVKMSRWGVIEYRRVYCLVFPWAVDLIIYCVLYKVFFNENFGVYLYYVNNFVKNYYMSYSKILWNHGTCLSGDGSMAWHLPKGLWAASLFRHSIYYIKFEILRIDILIV
jgi:hypothetical protein